MSFHQLSLGATVEIFSQIPRAAARAKGHTAKNSKLPNQYFLFCQQRRTALQAEHPGLSSREVTRILAEEWKSLSGEGKASFAEQYQQSIIKAREGSGQETVKGKKQLWLQFRTNNGQFVSIPAFCEI
jgi:hypothetical protein